MLYLKSAVDSAKKILKSNLCYLLALYFSHLVTMLKQLCKNTSITGSDDIVCPGKITNLTSPDTGLGSVQLTMNQETHMLKLPLGVYEYDLFLQGRSCSTTVKIAGKLATQSITHFNIESPTPILHLASSTPVQLALILHLISLEWLANKKLFKHCNLLNASIKFLNAKTNTEKWLWLSGTELSYNVSWGSPIGLWCTYFLHNSVKEL